MNISKMKKKQFNKGFSLITVIISVSFIGILGLLVLYMSLNNFQMRITEMKGRDSFYTAEQALEEICTGLQQDVGDSMSKAYIQVLETYDKGGSENSSLDVVMESERQKDFQEAFVTELSDLLKESSSEENINSDLYNMDHLRAYVDLDKINQNSSENNTFDPDKETLIVTNPSGKQPIMDKDTKNGIILRNIKVIYVDPKGHASIIETDIRLGIPKVHFPTPSTLPDLMNMVIVAQGGIICEPMAGTTTSIQGSIYAGRLSDENNKTGEKDVSIWVEPGNGNLTVESGDKVVSEGKIKVGQNSSFTSKSAVSLWAQGLSLSSANVNLLGTTYFSDDLTVEPGSGSNVTIEGNYFGYGSPSSAKNSKNQSRYEGYSDADLSSAIVINGKNTTMDFSGVKQLMVAGKSYIASSKVNAGDKVDKTNSDIITGESITVKGTQLAYLLPPELIELPENESQENIEVYNPMTIGDYDKYGFLKQNGIQVKMDTPVKDWSGKTLRSIGVDENNPVKEVFFKNPNDTTYVYFYLNFTDDKKAVNFMADYFHNNKEIKENLDRYLSFYFGTDGSGINIRNSEGYVRYVTNGNVLKYSEKSSSDSGLKADIYNATNSYVSDELKEEQTKYQDMWFTLNRKMITGYDFLNTSVKNVIYGQTDQSDLGTHNEADPKRTVFDNLVNEESMIAFLKDKAADQKKYIFESGDEGLKAVMYNNGHEGDNSEFVIDSQLADKLRLVVCTGDVKIEQGVKFHGIIMAKGKLTLGPGVQLISSPQEAAVVFQKQVTEDNISPKDFFWDGDNYVMGNNTDREESSGTANSKDTYDLGDCVTYENWKKE